MISHTGTSPTAASHPGASTGPAGGIPSTFHWLWLGPAPLPRQHRRWIDGWRRLHPGWEGVVWTDAELPPLENAHEFERARSPAQRADIARYEILRRHGGVYLDTDMECRRSIAPLLQGVRAFAGWETPTRVGNAVLGAEPVHPWVAALVDELPRSMARHGDTLRQTGPGFVTEVTAHRRDVVIFPPQVFYPYSPKHRHRPPPLGADTVAVHHWAGSWWESERGSADLLRARAAARLEEALPAGAPLILVDADLGLDGLRRPTLPFLERDGQPWGTPRDDAEAIAELSRMRDEGLHHIAFLQPAFWWFRHYPHFAEHLRREAVAVVDDDDVVAFEVR